MLQTIMDIEFSKIMENMF